MAGFGRNNSFIFSCTYLCTRHISVGGRVIKKSSAEIRIRYLTADLHRKLKVRAALESKTLNQTILDALLAYVKSSPKESL